MDKKVSVPFPQLIHYITTNISVFIQYVVKLNVIKILSIDKYVKLHFVENLKIIF